MKVSQIVEKKEKSKEYKTLMFCGRWEMFLVVRYIDEGSYGKVFLVQHKLTGFMFCLKVIRKSQLNENSFNQMIREIKIQSTLEHPNIVNLYGFSADAENIYMLLEPCLEENLFKKMQDQPLKEKEVKKYMKDICSAVEYMHKKDIIHRDIKP